MKLIKNLIERFKNIQPSDLSKIKIGTKVNSEDHSNDLDRNTKENTSKKNKFINKFFDSNKIKKFIDTSEPVVSLEITNKEIILFEISDTEQVKPNLKKAIFYPTDLAIQKDFLQNTYEISALLKKIFDEEKIQAKNIAISLPSLNCIIRTVTLPLMSEKNLSNSAKENNFWKEYIKTSDNFDEFSISYQVLSKNVTDGTMEILFTGTKLSEIELYKTIIEQAGLNLVYAQPKCFAIYQIQQKIKNSTSGNLENGFTAILEFGLGENYLMIVHQEKPLIADFFLRESDQELLSKATEEELQGIMRRYIPQLKQSIQDFEKKFEKRIRNIKVICNIDSCEKFLEIFRKELVNTSFATMNPFQELNLSEDIKNKISTKDSSLFSSLTGLALQKFDVFLKKNNKNFLEKINLAPSLSNFIKTKRIQLISQFCLKIFCILILGVYFSKITISTGSMFHYKKELNNFSVVNNNLEQSKKTLITLNKELEVINQSLKITNSVKSNRTKSYRILAQIANSVPNGVRFLSLEYNGDDEITIEGDATTDLSILGLITNLNKQSLIEQASLILVSSDKMGSNADRTKKGFKITCKIKKEDS